jgi:hypothetical protein
MVTLADEEVAAHTPLSVDVRVTITLPEAISAAEGV